MKTTKRLFSSLLAVAVILASLLIMPMASAEGEVGYTLETTATAVRIIPTNPAFEANVARTFDFTVPVNGEYAVFTSQTNTTHDYEVIFTPKAGGDAVTLETIAEGSGGHGSYNQGTYVRIGAISGRKSASAPLTAGEWTLSFKSLKANTIAYIDIRNTVFDVDGSKQAIYPVDYNTSGVGSNNHINGMINRNNAKVSGYTYFNDQSDAAYTTKYNYDHKIHVNSGVTTAYKINVTKAGNYMLSLHHSYYSYQASKNTNAATENVKGTFSVAVDNNEPIYTNSGEIKVYLNGGTSDESLKTWHRIKMNLTEGEHVISYKMVGMGSYLYNLTIEENLSYEDTVTHLDNNLVRIDLEDGADTIMAGVPREINFTVPVDGNYYFIARHTSTFTGNIAISVQDFDNNGSYQTIYNGSWADKENNAYMRLAGADTPPVALKANTNYKLLVSADSDITEGFIEAINVDIPVNGNTVVPTMYMSDTEKMSFNHLGCDDGIAGNILPTEGYTLVGDYTSIRKNPLIRPYLNNTNVAYYTLVVAKPGFYDFALTGGHYQGDNPYETDIAFALNGAEFDVATYSGTPSEKTNTVQSASIYLTEGTHTLTLSNIGKGGIYTNYLQITEAESGTGILNATNLPANLDKNLVANFDGDTPANILTEAGIALDNGESISWNLKSGAANLNLYALAGIFPEGAQIAYKIDNAEAVTVPVSKMSSIFENVAFAEGNHTFTITSSTDGLVLEDLRFSAYKTPVAQTGNRTLTALTNGTLITGAGTVSDATTTLQQGSVYGIMFNVETEGIYTFYMNANMLQASFNVYLNGEDVTMPWYRDLGTNNVNDSKYAQYKRVAVLKKLTPGEYTLMLETLPGYTSTLSGTVEMRRADAPQYTTASKGEYIIPAWDFTSTNVNSNGWYFIHQYKQGAVLEKAPGYEDTQLRNMVLDSYSGNLGSTYTINVPEDGVYQMALYHSTAGCKVRVSIDGAADVAYPITNSSNVIKEDLVKVYFTKGEHSVKVMKESVKGTMRYNALSFTKVDGVVENTTAGTASVSASFAEAVTGKGLVAFYNGEEFVKLAQVDLTDATGINVTEEGLAGKVDSVKVMVWADLTNVAPLITAIPYTKAANWTTK